MGRHTNLPTPFPALSVSFENHCFCVDQFRKLLHGLEWITRPSDFLGFWKKKFWGELHSGKHFTFSNWHFFWGDRIVNSEFPGMPLYILGFNYSKFVLHPTSPGDCKDIAEKKRGRSFKKNLKFWVLLWWPLLGTNIKSQTLESICRVNPSSFILCFPGLTQYYDSWGKNTITSAWNAGTSSTWS